MLNPLLNGVYSLLGIYGGGLYPVVLIPVLCYTFSLYALEGVAEIQGDAFRTSLLVERAVFVLINVSAVAALRIYWPRISRTLVFLSRARCVVGSKMRLHTHTLALFLVFTSFNSSMLIHKSVLAGSVAGTLPEFLHFLLYNNLMVQYTDMLWTVEDLFACLNRSLAKELARPVNGKKWLKLIDLHRHLVRNAADLHGCFRFHMLIAISYVFLKMILIPYQVIRNWMRPAVGTLVTNSYLNLLLIAFDLNYVISLFTPPTVAQDQSNKTRKVLREFANKENQRREILSAIRILSENDLKFTFYGLFNVRTMSFIPMLDAITTNLVILLNYN